MAYGSSAFVAVASSGTGTRVMTSQDCVTWSVKQSAADLSWTSVCFGNGRFVAVASSGTGQRVMTGDVTTGSVGILNIGDVATLEGLFVDNIFPTPQQDRVIISRVAALLEELEEDQYLSTTSPSDIASIVYVARNLHRGTYVCMGCVGALLARPPLASPPVPPALRPLPTRTIPYTPSQIPTVPPFLCLEPVLGVC